ncbi:carbohydrate ABC transporter substrate-binding protein, CUT1 family [Halobacillus dabanensis]|uniref:Carbohydrate ABC transporter substrate-binding protein, CUT1 family n=1 Tax=Halobacillus dabanensis TaxID=240302 RepID=A0A1I3ZZL8_HALDA|nr:sugar ABC transporter substrate-binding protein [Halobacillus dabanensis]SFK49483.1 carbohydrate ABC transporter substrate-binding protein, CUT1 family [Halobacillus dabanensis]
MKNLKLHWLIVGLMLSVVLIGCSSQSGGSGGEDKGVTIEFMHTSVEQERLDVINGLISKFEEENPDITIDPVVVEESNLTTKIVTLAQSGELPEVIEVGQDYAKVMDKDALIDTEAVNEVIGNIGGNNYYEGALKLVRTEDGESYRGVPISGWVQGIWYDKEMLASKGFEEPQSWEEVKEVAKAFTDVGNQEYGIALPTVENTFSEQAFSQFALSNNANILNSEGEITLDTPEMQEALSFYKDLAQYTMPGSNGVTEVKDAFMNGTAPMAMYSTYLLPAVYEAGKAENLGYAIPNEEQEAVYGTVSSLTIPAGLEDKQKEAAQTFIEFLSEGENATEYVLMSPGGAQPVSKNVVENETYQSNEVIQAFGDLPTEIAESFNEIKVFGLVDDKNYVKMGDITSSNAIPLMINDAVVGGASVDEAMQTAKDQLDKVVD